MNHIDVNDLMIRTLPTPNPMALKFILNGPFKNEGKASFSSPHEAQDLPLIRDLFSIDGVKQVHVFQNTLTVTHSGELDDDGLSNEVAAVIKSRYSVHNPDFGEKPKPVRERHVHHDNPEMQRIEEILDRTIRPGLQADGGDIEVLSYSNNELRILYQGACGGCPSSMMGTLDAIQGILRNEMDNNEIVVLPA